MTVGKGVSEDFQREVEERLQYIQEHLPPNTLHFAWESVATQLFRLLCDSRAPLLTRVLPELTLHPLHKYLEPDTYIWAAGWNCQRSQSGIVYELVDEAETPIGYDRWLEQVVLVADGCDLTIRDIICFSRDENAAHYDPRRREQTKALAKAARTSVEGQEHASLPVAIGAIGAYLLRRVHQLSAAMAT